MIIFQKLKITSFKSIFKAELDFDGLKGRLYSLEGINHTVDFAHSNGAGKSTLLQALMFALYGSVDDSVTIKKADYQNKNTNIKLKVELTLSIQGVQYEITRTDKDFKLIREGEDISELTKTETEKKFLALLNLTKSEFTNFTYLSQSSSGSFLTKTPMEKLNCIKDFIFNEELLAIQTKLDTAIKSCRAEGSEIGVKIADIQGRMDTLQKLVAQRGKQVQLPCTLAAYQGQFESLSTMQNECNKQKQELSKDKTRLEQIRVSFRKEKERYKLIKEENVCPECGQQLPSTTHMLAQSKARLMKLKEDGETLKGRIAQREGLINGYPDYNSKLREISDNIATLKQQARENKQYEKMQGDMDQFNQEVTDLQKRNEENQMRMTQLTQLQKFYKTDFIKYIQQAFISEIENYLNLYCRDIFDEDFKLLFYNNSLELTIGGMPYSYFSGGERQRIDFLFVFAIKVALTHFTNKCTNLFIADESLSGQDSEAFENCLELVAELTSAEELTTILVSHRDIDYKVSKIVIERFESKTELIVQDE